MMETIHCQCGKESVDCDKASNVGSISNATGFKPIFLEGNGLSIAWLCPDCWKIAEDLALKLKDIVKNEHVRIYQVISKDKRNG